jgi:hypothetical protein
VIDPVCGADFFSFKSQGPVFLSPQASLFPDGHDLAPFVLVVLKI